MDQPNVLRTTKIGGGFVKEDVLAYVDELNSQIYQLSEENSELKKKLASGGSGLSDQQRREIEAEMSRLRGELGTTKNRLRAAQEELKARPVIQADGSEGVSPADLEAAKQEATDARADLAAVRAELELAQAEIAENAPKVQELEARIQSLNEDNEALRQDLAAEAAKALTAGGSSDALNAQIAEYQQQIATLQGQLSEAEEKVAAAAAEQIQMAGQENETISQLREELAHKTAMLEEQAGLSNEADLQKLAEYEAMISEQTHTISERDREIEQLQQQVADLKENAQDTSFDMGALFMEAQMTAKKVTSEAKREADKRVKEATTQAETIISDAKAEAEKTVADAKAQAEQTIADAEKQAEETISTANAEAERKINDADAQAIKTVSDAEESVRASIADAERRNKTTTETARTVRALLRSEIDSVSKKFGEISLVLENLTGQAGSRLTEAKNVIAEARGTVNDDDDLPSFESFEEVASKSFGGTQPARGDAKQGGGFEFSVDDLADLATDGGSGSWS